MTTTEVSLFTALICSWLVLVLAVMLAGLQSGQGLWNLGGKIMSVIDEAIARFTRFTQGVLDQLKGAKSANDAQTEKLAELTAALSVALSDDATDKSTISALQAEVSSLQEEVAAKINAVVDTLENPPAPEPSIPVEGLPEGVLSEVVEEVPVEVVEEVPVEEVPPVSE